MSCHHRAADAVGNTSTQTRSLVADPSPPGLPAPPDPPDPPAPPAPQAGDRVAPLLSGARVEPKTLPVTTKAMLRVMSTESAQLVGSVQRRTARGWERVARKQWPVERGANAEKLYGKAAQRRLKSGTYRVRLVATDAAGNTSSTSTVRFRVARG